MNLVSICRYIQEKLHLPVDSVTAGRIDDKESYTVGVFDYNRSQTFRMAIGGAENTKYKKQNIHILVHWGSQSESAQKAEEIHRLFYGLCNLRLENCHIAFCIAYEPQCLGYTRNKVFEYVIPIEIYINKEES